MIPTEVLDNLLSMQEVYWPSITICNLNQAEASYWKSIGAYANVTMKNEILEERDASKYYVHQFGGYLDNQLCRRKATI